jgi:hypothetical protein
LKKLFTAFILFCCIVAANAQTVTLFGKVYSLNDSSVLTGVHVINVTRQNATTSDVEGYFVLDVSPSDKLMFTSIGYESYSLTLPAETKENLSLTVFLEQANYQIDTITILPYPNKDRFKHAFMNLKLPEEKNKIVLNIPKDVMSIEFEDDIRNKKVSSGNEINLTNNAGGGLLSLIFGKFDPAQKDKDRKKDFDDHKNRMAEIERKYSNEFIEKLTGLKGEEPIVAFKKFCNLPNEFIINNNEYTIAEAIVECYKQFEKTH